MSYQVGMDTIHLRPTPRLGHVEYCDHESLMQAVVAQHSSRPVEKMSWIERFKSFNEAWDMDLMWVTNDGPVSLAQRGRTTDMGHAEYMAGGVDRREPKPSPFSGPEEVWAFDAVKEYAVPAESELVAYYENWWQKSRQENPTLVFTGGYYDTLVSGAIRIFGWDNLLEAAADRDKFDKVLDSIFRLSLNYYQAQAKTSIEVFISHDDMVWSEGAFMHPDFYRRAIFPRYRELWKPLKDAGKKVLFCSDADFTEFIDDIFAAGADGLIFEPMTSLDYVVEKYGRTKVIVGSKVDCRTLTFGTCAQIQAEIDATLKLAFDCPGFFCAIGNHIPANVPMENALFYMDYLRKHWNRPH